MKKLLLIILCLQFLNSFAQNKTPDFDGPAWQPPYTLTLEGWGIERFLIPIDFAPSIPYAGVEDLRFTQGWGNVKSEEYWSYAYLWFLDGNIETNSTVIKTNLAAYYDGLVGRNIEKRKIPAEKVFPARVSIDTISTQLADLNTFSGKIEMLDYMEQKPITLNCIIHHRTCAGKNKTLIFYEISPRPFTDAVWSRLNKLWTDFICGVRK